LIVKGSYDKPGMSGCLGGLPASSLRWQQVIRNGKLRHLGGELELFVELHRRAGLCREEHLEFVVRQDLVGLGANVCFPNFRIELQVTDKAIETPVLLGSEADPGV